VSAGELVFLDDALMGRLRMDRLRACLENDKVAEMSENGRLLFLAKPFTTEQLLHKLHELLEVVPA